MMATRAPHSCTTSTRTHVCHLWLEKAKTLILIKASTCWFMQQTSISQFSPSRGADRPLEGSCSLPLTTTGTPSILINVHHAMIPPGSRCAGHYAITAPSRPNCFLSTVTTDDAVSTFFRETNLREKLTSSGRVRRRLHPTRLDDEKDSAMVALRTSALQASLSALPPGVRSVCTLPSCALNKLQTQDPASRPEGDERHVWPADIKSVDEGINA